MASAGRVVLSPPLLSALAVAQVHREHTRNILSLDFDSSGRFLVSAGEDEALNLYDCEAGRHVKASNSKKYGVDLARFVNKTSSNVVYASTKGDDALRLMSLHDNKYIRYFRGHEKRVIALDLNPLNDAIMSGGLDGVRLWDLRSPNCQAFMNFQGSSLVAYDPSGVVFAVALQSETIRMYDSRSFEAGPFIVFRSLRDPDRPGVKWTGLEFSADGKYLLVSTDHDVVYLVDAFVDRIVHRLTGQANKFAHRQLATFTPDGQSVICGSSDGTVHMWRVGDGGNIAVLRAHHMACNVVKFNPQFAMMASANLEMAFWLPSDEAGPLASELDVAAATAPSGLVVHAGSW